MVSCAITSDVGGSTRIPAGYCGLYGLKPTGGTVSNQQTYPSCGDGAINNYCQLGPMASHAADLLPLLRVIAQKPIRDPNSVNVRELRFLDMSSVVGGWLVASSQHPDLFDSHRSAARTLRSLGCQVDVYEMPSSLKDAGSAFDIWSTFMDKANAEPFLETITKGPHSISSNPSPLKLLIMSIFTKIWGGDFTHTIPAAALAALDTLLPYIPASRTEKLLKLGEELREELAGELGEDTVILWPGLPSPAPRHDEPLLRLFDSANTSILNTLEFPSAAVPLGLGARSGLPVGFQIVANRHCDHLCLAVAMFLERVKIASSPLPSCV